MITIENKPSHFNVAILGQFTVSDFREFEEQVLYSARFQGGACLTLDLRAMSGYTIDMVWEEIRFVRNHPQHFSRIAVVTDDQWVSWLAWLFRLYMEADVQLFDDMAEAETWLADAAAQDALET